MKRFVITAYLLLLALSCWGQGIFSIQSVPVCWSINGIDSSLVANWLISANNSEPAVLGYLNATGQAVSVSGGSVANGYCCCGESSPVSVTDNMDGTYTIIVGADTTIIRTTTAVCGDTIIQAGHGFSVGDLLGQAAGNGPYFLANTADPDSFPVTAVREVIDDSTMVICEEGLFPGFAHGLPLGQDYFLQDDGSLDTIPDPDYQVFAFRTRSSTEAYFDIPELVVTGAGAGGGGTSYTVIASNGLNDADPTANVDVELGGTLDKDTDIELGPYNFTLNRTGAGIKLQVDGGSTTDGIRISPNPAFDLNRPRGSFLYKNTTAGNPASVQWADYDLPIVPPLVNNTHAHYVYDPFSGSYWVSELVSGSGLQARDSAQYYFRYYLGGDLLENTAISLNSGQYDFEVTDGFPAAGLTDSVFLFRLSYDAPNYFQFEFDKDIGGGTLVRSDIRVNNDEMYLRYSKGGNGTVFRITPYSVVINSPPNYASDAAADADVNLPAGGIYTVTAEDRTLRIKP